MSEASRRLPRIPACRWALGWLMLCMWAPVGAQIAPRLTGEVALGELAAAGEGLATPVRTSPESPLAAVGKQLADMTDALRRTLGNDADKPIETMSDKQRAAVLRAHAAAARVQSFLTASVGCQGSEAGAMQAALAAGMSRLANDSASARLVPVVDGVETMAHQPLFAIHQGTGPLAFALTGSNLTDRQCADPRVTATDPGGKLLPSQPQLTGAVAGRIEMRWPDAGALPAGSVVLHVATQHKVFLLGCTALPEASTVIQVAPQSRYEVEYTLSAICPAAPSKDAAGSVTLGHGTMPDLVGYGTTVSQAIDTSACTDPRSYQLNAVVRGSDGSRTSAGPFSQSAQAAITAGLPGGLSLSWNPSAQMLFVRTGARTCKGVD